MVRRTRVDLEEIADLTNLSEAAWRAARGKRHRVEVRAFFANLETELSLLGSDLLRGSAPYGRYHVFQIHDPKPRIITAPCFRDRVIHHALIQKIGPRLEAALVPSCVACRRGMGNLAAIEAAQRGLRRADWYVHLDIKSYFDSIDHRILIGLLDRYLKGHDLIPLVIRLLESHETAPGKGLPIGALTSQYFANLYLDGLDRFLRERVRVRHHVRYMDDTVWWTDNKARALESRRLARTWLGEHRSLEVKGQGIVNRSDLGLTFCGYRIQRSRLRLTRRKRERYRAGLRKWERFYREGRIDDRRLQAGYWAIHAPTAHADAARWRRACLESCGTVVV